MPEPAPGPPVGLPGSTVDVVTGVVVEVVDVEVVGGMVVDVDVVVVVELVVDVEVVDEVVDVEVVDEVVVVADELQIFETTTEHTWVAPSVKHA